MAEHIVFEINMKPVEEGLPEDNKIYWVRRKDRGCLRQAGYMDDSSGYSPGWYLFPGGGLIKGVTHYGRPPQMGPTPCDEQREAVLASERHN